MNYYVSINIDQIPNTFIRKIKGKSGAEKLVAMIQLEDNPAIFCGKKHYQLSAIAWEKDKPEYDQTHSIKVSLPKEVREKMSDEERKAIPYIGGMKPKDADMTSNAPSVTEEESDLPF